MRITTSSVLTASSSGASLRLPRRLLGHPGCGFWDPGIERIERPPRDMRQRARPLCRHSQGGGTERRDRRGCVASQSPRTEMAVIRHFQERMPMIRGRLQRQRKLPTQWFPDRKSPAKVGGAFLETGVTQTRGTLQQRPDCAIKLWRPDVAMTESGKPPRLSCESVTANHFRSGRLRASARSPF